MAFPARFAGKCKACGHAIEKGQYITWSRREKGSATHVDCSNPNAVPEAKELVGSPESITAAIESAVARIMEAKGMSAPAPNVTAIVDETTSTKTALAPAPIPKTKTKKALKANAAWYEILETIVNWSNEAKEYIRVLLIGPPGTGKSTTCAILAGIKKENRITFTEGMDKEEAIGMFQLIKGETVYVPVKITSALAKGEPMLWDEVDHHPAEIGSGMYGWLDDDPHATLSNGETQTYTPGYAVFATTNSNVSSLPEAILDRFDAVILAITPHPATLARLEDKNMAEAVSYYYSRLSTSPWEWSGKISNRRMWAFKKLRNVVGEANAATLAFGSAGTEILGVLTTASRTGAL